MLRFVAAVLDSYFALNESENTTDLRKMTQEAILKKVFQDELELYFPFVLIYNALLCLIIMILNTFRVCK